MYTRAQLMLTQSLAEGVTELKQFMTGAAFQNITDAGPGTFQYQLLMLASKLYTGGQEQAATLTKQAIERTASGDFLTEISDSFFNNQRTQATQTVGQLRLTNTSGPYTFGPGGLKVNFTGQDNVVYSFANTSTLILTSSTPAAYSYGSFTAVEPGAGSAAIDNGTEGDVIGAAGVTAFIPGDAAGGETLGYDTTLIDGWKYSDGVDEEPDQSLHIRNQTKWATLSTAETPADRIKQAVASASLGAVFDTYVDATNPRGPGSVDVYCAGASAPATSVQLAAISGSVQALFMNGSMLVGGYPRVHLKPALTSSFGSGGVNTAIKVFYTQDYTQADVQSMVEETMDTWIESVPVGGRTYSSVLQNIADVEEVFDKLYDVPGVEKVSITNQQDIDLSSSPYTKLVAPTSWSSIFSYVALPRSYTR